MCSPILWWSWLLICVSFMVNANSSAYRLYLYGIYVDLGFSPKPLVGLVESYAVDALRSHPNHAYYQDTIFSLRVCVCVVLNVTKHIQSFSYLNNDHYLKCWWSGASLSLCFFPKPGRKIFGHDLDSLFSLLCLHVALLKLILIAIYMHYPCLVACFLLFTSLHLFLDVPNGVKVSWTNVVGCLCPWYQLSILLW
jgi:hypothetical protein